MMTLLYYLLAFVLIVDCLLLALLVLIQLPKKEAGIGMAFGGSAADALFGAGSGTALTKLTKYCAIAFFALVLVLCMVENGSKGTRAADFERSMETRSAPATQTPPPTQPPPDTSGVPLLSPLVGTNTNAASPGPSLTLTNLPARTNK